MKNILTLFVAFSAITVTLAQSPCLPEGITFTTQAQIDNFRGNYPGCTEIQGDVEINGGDITNVDSLFTITLIQGSLTIGDAHQFPSGNPNLEDLSGMINLTSVGQDLTIAQNYLLMDLAGLENLNAIGGNLTITDNNNLSTLGGLNQLNSVGGLGIGGNDFLENMNGLEGLTTIESHLSISFTKFTNLTGLNNLTSIGGNFIVLMNFDLLDFEGLNSLSSIGGNFNVGYSTDAMWWGNSSLYNFSGLDNLSSIGGHLHITDNEELNNLNGLEGLTSIGGELYIGALWSDSIPGLVSIDALGNVEAESIENLLIIYNTSLSKCQVQSICEYLTAPGNNSEIHDNAPGCNDVEEVNEACKSGGVKEQALLFLLVHPNPTDNGRIIITLNNPQNLHLTCFNTYGQQVHHQEIADLETEINVSTWAPGIYLAVVYEDGLPVGSIKFVVMN